MVYPAFTHALYAYHTFPYMSLAIEGLFCLVFREAFSRPRFYSLLLFKSMVQNLLASDFIGQLSVFHRKPNGRWELPAVWCLMGNFLPSLLSIFFYSSPIIFVCNWMPLSYTILANSISSNYSVLVHCNVPANNLKCAGGGCSTLPASRSLSHLHAPCGGNLMWWLWHRLQWRQWQGPEPHKCLFYLPSRWLFFCNIPFSFLSSKKDKVRACIHL